MMEEKSTPKRATAAKKTAASAAPTASEASKTPAVKKAPPAAAEKKTPARKAVQTPEIATQPPPAAETAAAPVTIIAAATPAETVTPDLTPCLLYTSMGIATKNSILLVDYVILARREHGLDRWNALLDACRKRARPIIMTTVAMGAGMLPIAIGLGTDPSFRAPMAIVVIGGLITSTFLSLLVIPVVFTYVDDAVGHLKRLRPKRQG